MKFKAKENLNLRDTPSINGKKIGTIKKDSIVESDEYTWKKVTLKDGAEGFCASEFLEEAPEPKWHIPIREDKFIVTQKFLNPDKETYPKTGCHPGVDYGTQGEKNVPLYFCADGEVIESKTEHKFFGNSFFYYVEEVDKTFVYFHLKNAPPEKGKYKAGEKCGVAGDTGLSEGIHLHLECIEGKVTSTKRAELFTSKESLKENAKDADKFIKERLDE